MHASQRLVPIVLLICVFLFVFTEVLLSPFYPQFFKKVFGIDELSFTGMYIFICRFTVVLISPLWGMLSRKIDSKRLLIIGQIGTACSCALLAMSQNEFQFIVFSVLLLIFKSSYLLLYTILIEQAGFERKRVTGTYHAVFQGAVIVATLASSWVIQMDQPLTVFWWAALLDALMAIMCLILFNSMNEHEDTDTATEPVKIVEKTVDHMFLLKMALILFTLHFSVTLIRPFFTIFSENVLHTSVFQSSLLFLIPSIMAIAAAPFIVKISLDKFPVLYRIAGILLGISVLLQGLVEEMVLFILLRCIFGFCLAICQSSLEIVLFQRNENVHYQYGIVSAFQNLGLLLAPLSATYLVEGYSLQHPFIIASLFIGVHLILVMLTIYKKERSQRTPIAEANQKVV